MVRFESKPYAQSSSFDALAAQAKKKPFLYFGLPFLTIMVAGSFGLSQLTQTKFDHRDRKHTKVLRKKKKHMLYTHHKKKRLPKKKLWVWIRIDVN